MAYTALYRKLRPQNFADVVGQGAIVRTLINQIKSGRVSHAYLFCGTRGTGKTSTAKIFARAVNCECSGEGEPCNECQVCRDILEQRSMNVIEIDAASNNGVDNIRDIREEVKYPPTEGRYKVYIIDEVHMLSAGAFNALLKTLEEPPAHVIFILATTDPQKIPPTILSRCQRFDFKRIGSDEMVETMRDYMSREGVCVEDDALRTIANISDGAMRDSLSLLDQCISFYFNETITLEKVLRLLGAVDVSVLFDFADAVYARDSAAALAVISRLLMDGRDVSQFVADVIQHFRNILVAASVEKQTTALDFSAERVERFRTQGRKIGNALVLSYVNTFSLLQSQLRYASNPRIMVEIAALKLCSPAGGGSLEDLSARMEKLEQDIQASCLSAAAAIQPAAVSHTQSEAQPAAQPETQPAAQYETQPAAQPETLPPQKPENAEPPAVSPAAPASRDRPETALDWGGFVRSLGNPLRTILSTCEVKNFEGGVLQIVCPDPPQKQFLTKRREMIEELLEERFHQAVALSVQISNSYEAAQAPQPSEKDLFEELQSKINMKIDFD